MTANFKFESLKSKSIAFSIVKFLRLDFKLNGSQTVPYAPVKEKKATEHVTQWLFLFFKRLALSC